MWVIMRYCIIIGVDDALQCVEVYVTFDIEGI
jgi:hypothetical protein